MPTGVLLSTKDVTVRRWAERDHNIVRWTELERGGHFLAMEAPESLVGDLRAFFGGGPSAGGGPVKTTTGQVPSSTVA